MKSSLIFLLLVGSSLALDRFRFAYTFKCDLKDREKWNYRVEFWEWDNLQDDQITTVEYGTAPPGSASGVVFGTQDGDASPSYEPYMIVYHDCTDDGHEAYIWASLKYSRVGWHSNYKFTMDLTNKHGTFYDIGAEFKTTLEPFPDEIVAA